MIFNFVPLIPKKQLTGSKKLRLMIWVVVKMMVPFLGTLNIRCRKPRSPRPQLYLKAQGT